MHRKADLGRCAKQIRFRLRQSLVYFRRCSRTATQVHTSELWDWCRIRKEHAECIRLHEVIRHGLQVAREVEFEFISRSASHATDRVTRIRYQHPQRVDWDWRSAVGGLNLLKLFLHVLDRWLSISCCSVTSHHPIELEPAGNVYSKFDDNDRNLRSFGSRR